MENIKRFLEYIQKKVDSNKDVPNDLLINFFTSKIDKKQKELERWVFDVKNESIFNHFVYSLGYKKKINRAKFLLEIQYPEIVNDKNAFNHFEYRNAYIGYFASSPLDTLIDLVTKNKVTKDNPSSYFSFLFERYTAIAQALKKQFKKINTDKLRTIIKIITTTHLAIKEEISFDNFIKSTKIEDKKLAEEACVVFFQNNHKKAFTQYPQKSLELLSNCNKVNINVLKSFVTLQKNKLEELVSYIKNNPKLFYNSEIYKILGKKWKDSPITNAIKFAEKIKNKEILAAFLSSLIEFHSSSSFNFSSYCNNLKDFRLRKICNVALSKRLLKTDSQKAITLFLKSYSKESEIISFFKTLVKTDLSLASEFIRENRFSLYTESNLIGIITYYNIKQGKLFSTIKHIPAINTKISLGTALSKYNNSEEFIRYITSLETEYKNEIFKTLKFLIKRK